jgi:hypothetical protein
MWSSLYEVAAVLSLGPQQLDQQTRQLMQSAHNGKTMFWLSIQIVTLCIMLLCYVNKKSKAIPKTGRGGLYCCEMLRIPHCLGIRLTVNSEILATCSSTYSPVRTSQEAHSVSIK